MLGPEISLSLYPATPSTPKSLIFRLKFVKANHNKQAHQASSFCKASILFEKEPRFTCTFHAIHVSLLTLILVRMHFAVCSDLDPAVSYEFSCVLTPLFHFSTVIIVLRGITAQ